MSSDSDPSSQDGTKRRVPAVIRAVAILDLLAQAPEPKGVSQIARELELPKSSVHGICETLRDLALLRSDGTRYDLGPRPLKWSSAFLQRSDLVTEFHRVLSNDSRISDYTVTLSSLQGSEVVYLACRNSTKPLGFMFQAGMHLPAVYTATGKAMLAQLDPKERKAALTGRWPAPLTARSVRDRNAFEKEAQRWRQQNYAVDDGQIREGMFCLGASIIDHAGRPVAGIAISMTAAEARPEIIKRFGKIVQQVAAAIAPG